MVEKQMNLKDFKDRLARRLSRPERALLLLTALFAAAAVFFALRPAGELRLERAALRVQPEAALIDLNTADADELESLPGIGPELAGRILLDREQNGPYSTPSDLMRVDGIGEKTVSALAPFVLVSEPKEDTP